MALVTGAKDFNRLENEKFMLPLLRNLGVRCRLWLVPKMGHAIPGPAVLGAVLKWVDEDQARRQRDARQYPGAGLSAGGFPDAEAAGGPAADGGRGGPEGGQPRLAQRRPAAGVAGTLAAYGAGLEGAQAVGGHPG